MPSSHVGLGLTGVVLCGKGTSLCPVMSPARLSKPLIRIANKPMIQYSLEWLQEGGITSVIIVCLNEHESGLKLLMQLLTKKQRTTQSSPVLRFTPTIVSVGPAADSLGTAEVLRMPNVQNLIKTDFIIVPCDVICEIPAGVLVNHWMSQEMRIGGQKGALTLYYENGSDKSLERDVIVTSPIPSHPISRANPNFPSPLAKNSNLLLPLRSKVETAKIRHSLIKQHPRLNIQSTLRDSHIYILPYWVLTFIAQNPYGKIISIKEDVFEHLAKASWQGRGLYAQKLGITDILEGAEEVVAVKDLVESPSSHGSDDDDEDAEADNEGDYFVSDKAIKHRDDYIGLSTMRQSHSAFARFPTVRNMNNRSWATEKTPVTAAHAIEIRINNEGNAETRPSELLYGGFYSPPIIVFTPDMEITTASTTPLVRRVDTIPILLATSLEIARNNPPAVPISESALIHQRSTVSTHDCIIGDECNIEEKALVKRSVLSANVTIGKMARIIGCVIMEGAYIGEGVKLDGCVVGRKARVEKSCTLVNCEVGEDVTVDEHTEGKTEKFEIEDDEDDDEESSDDMEVMQFEDDDDESEEEEDIKGELQIISTSPATPSKGENVKPTLATTQGEEQVEDEREGEEEEEDTEFSPSDDSSFCAEEYDSEYESEEVDEADVSIAASQPAHTSNAENEPPIKS